MLGPSPNVCSPCQAKRRGCLCLFSYTLSWFAQWTGALLVRGPLACARLERKNPSVCLRFEEMIMQMPLALSFQAACAILTAAGCPLVSGSPVPRGTASYTCPACIICLTLLSPLYMEEEGITNELGAAALPCYGGPPALLSCGLQCCQPELSPAS